MAAADYYLQTEASHQLQGRHAPNPYSPQQQQQHHYNTTQPSYSLHSQQNEHQQLQPYQHQIRPDPYNSPPPVEPNYPNNPLGPVRSHSQPAHVHFADHDSVFSLSDNDDSGHESDSASDSDSNSDYSSRHHRHHSNRHDRHDHEHQNVHEREYTRESHNDNDRQYRHRHGKTHKNRDTFLGASAGSLIGGALFPGVGAVGGLVLGGLGGRKLAKRRSRSEESRRYEHRDRGRGRHWEGI